ncbi:peroxisomal membrane protein 11B-like [Clytia hemisphaerica]|uniref:peroxisomal membrane protein 11B-like n=1 Tax=Clytia hemisphaerica TaxID=252671 RepID=UPI0034D5517D
MTILSIYLQQSGKVASRDKVYRLLQYCSKLVGHHISDPNLLVKLKQFEGILSTSRKTFRLFKTVDMLFGATQAYLIHDPVLRSLLMLSKLSQAIYFLYDLLSWSVKAGLVKADAQKLSHRSSQFWAMALLSMLLRDLYEIKMAQRNSGSNIEQVLEKNPPLVLDLVKNGGDMILALNMLNKITVSKGTVGLAGVVSSLVGLLQALSPSYKLVP